MDWLCLCLERVLNKLNRSFKKKLNLGNPFSQPG
ncbi:hypothetical protein V6Z12_D06G256700 [Gossypium hirsutum]